MTQDKDQHQAIEPGFRQLLEETVRQQLYVKVHYHSQLHELLKVSSVAKRLEVRNEEEYLVLASGEEIPVAQLVKLGDTPAPGHDQDDFYNCACS